MSAPDTEQTGTIQPGVTINEGHAARLRMRRSHVADPAAQLLALREQLRAEVMDEELGRLTDTILLQQQTIERMSGRIESLGKLVSDLSDVRKEDIEELLSHLRDGMVSRTVTHDVPAAPVLEPSVPDDSADIYVSDAFLDFLQVFSYHSNAVVTRAPLLQGLRTEYDNKGRFMLTIRMGGTLGTEFHMRNTRLILGTGDPESDNRPYVEGTYTDGNRNVPLTEEQVERILETLCHEATNFYDPEPQAAE